MGAPAAIAATYRENWPAALAALAPRAVSVRLGPAEIAAIGWHTPLFRGAVAMPVQAPDFAAGFLDAAGAALSGFAGGVFARLGHCSWKGSDPFGVPIRDIGALRATITRPDDRIARALLRALAPPAPLALHLVDWRTIAPEEELRVFIRGGRWIGVSQYDLTRVHPWLLRHRDEVEAALSRFAAALAPALHLRDVVVDVALIRGEGALGVELIELNPFLPETDAGLYDWRRDDFDRRLRLREA